MLYIDLPTHVSNIFKEKYPIQDVKEIDYDTEYRLHGEDFSDKIFDISADTSSLFHEESLVQNGSHNLMLELKNISPYETHITGIAIHVSEMDKTSHPYIVHHLIPQKDGDSVEFALTNIGDGIATNLYAELLPHRDSFESYSQGGMYAVDLSKNIYDYFEAPEWQIELDVLYPNESTIVNFCKWENKKVDVYDDVLINEVEYTFNYDNSSQDILNHTPYGIFLTPYGLTTDFTLGVGGPSSAAYTLKLDTSQEEYSVEAVTSEYISSGEILRVPIVLSADGSCDFSYQVEFVVDNEYSVFTPKTSVEYHWWNPEHMGRIKDISDPDSYITPFDSYDYIGSILYSPEFADGYY